MKKIGILFVICLIALAGCGYWLLQSTEPDNLQRSEIIIDVEDVFEK